MGYACKIIEDSITQFGVRLTTFEITYPRFILAEVNTHRMLSRNTASSRAIPVEKLLRRVLDDPFIPIYWGKNQKGMSAKIEIDDKSQSECRYAWLSARDSAVQHVHQLLNNHVHKQTANRLLEPFLWVTQIITATDWDNFFNLRCHRDAQPEIQVIAKMMRAAYSSAQPRLLQPGEWHLPYVTLEERRTDRTIYWPRISAGRSARVSYLTHDGRRDLDADLRLYADLVHGGHMSPLEHPARNPDWDDPDFGNIERYVGNFRYWIQLRKMIPGEAVFKRENTDEEGYNNV